jgi:hypothetical protein
MPSRIGHRPGATILRAPAPLGGEPAAELRAWHLLDERTQGVTSAVLVPGWGASVVAASFQHPDLAWPIPLLEPVDLSALALKPTSYGVPLLAPTPGRVSRSGKNGQFEYAGRRYEPTTARHGFLRNRAWDVREASATRLRCALDVAPDPAAPASAFPFEFQARYDVELVPGGFRCALTFANAGERTQPLAVAVAHETGVWGAASAASSHAAPCTPDPSPSAWRAPRLALA